MTRRQRWKTALACAALFGASSYAQAATIDLVATADGFVFVNTSSGLPGVPGSVSLGQLTDETQNVIPGQELRSVYEFDLPVLSDTITSATFLGTVVGNSAPPATLSFFGYSGNGTIDAADAVQLSNSVGSTTVGTASSLSPVAISVPLTASFVQSLGSGFLGLTTTVGSPETVLVASLISSATVKPTLRLETAGTSTPGTPGTPTPVPEPGTMLLLGSGLIGAASRKRAAKHMRQLD